MRWSDVIATLPALVLPACASPCRTAPVEAAPFEDIATVDALKARLPDPAGRTTLVDVYADWCAPCRHLRDDVFPAPDVAPILARMQRLTVDVSDDSDHDRALWQHLGVSALPTVVFYGPDGAEIPDSRYTEVLGRDHFRDHLARVVASR